MYQNTIFKVLILMSLNMFTFISCKQKCEFVVMSDYVIKIDEFYLLVDTSLFNNPYEINFNFDDSSSKNTKYRKLFDLRFREIEEEFYVNITCLGFEDTIEHDYPVDDFNIDKYYFVEKFYSNYGKNRIIDSLYYIMIEKYKNSYLVTYYGDVVSVYKHNLIKVDYISKINKHQLLNIEFQLLKDKFQSGDSSRIIQIIESVRIIDNKCSVTQVSLDSIINN